MPFTLKSQKMVIKEFLHKKCTPPCSKTAVKNIIDSYKEENLVLVLGAGVSIEFGVPSWNYLLQNLMVHTINENDESNSFLSKLFNEIFNPNPLIAGRYLQDYFEDKNTKSSKKNVCSRI